MFSAGDELEYGLSVQLKDGNWVKFGVKTKMGEGETIVGATSRLMKVVDKLVTDHVQELDISQAGPPL